ncbi:UDP-glucuronosyltransferase 2B15-like [Photinus pyralis]|uniref:UDP-glucuronosyltransferase 2B15-like n=1 Tax=Photinus pyralis TaxID=7054 RepID=UPI001266F38D|nr:UDP-glucuronosyltransferase 2B15-like [Photinus pyralis]
MNIVKTLVTILTLTRVGECARILGIIPTPSYSHQVPFQPLWKELSLRGHQVTVLTSHPMKDPSLKNLTEIDLSFTIKILEDKVLEIVNSSHNIFKVMDLSIRVFHDINVLQLQHHQVQKLINDPDGHFDLLIAEYMSSPMLYFSRRFNCPYIGVHSLDSSNAIYRLFGHPAHPIVYPDIVIGVYGKSSLFQRVQIILFELCLYFMGPKLRGMEEETAWKYFGDRTPSETIRNELSLLFINSDPVFDYKRPLLPSVIQIGGTIARVPVKPLENRVKKILDGASEGFIYFSLGSNIKSKDISPRTLNVILDTFWKLPYKVLWKYELDDLANKPSNVHILRWVSQMEVLGHPNLKLFITHGGLHSMHEAVHARVPMVGMPFSNDQPYNVKKMVGMGIALHVDYHTMTTEELENAIVEVIRNPSYRERVKELAELVEGQPMTGLERAVWWTEHVLRHKGAPHFRSPFLDVPWYQYYLLDVSAMILLTLSVVTFVLSTLLRRVIWIFKRLSLKNTKSKKE